MRVDVVLTELAGVPSRGEGLLPYNIWVALGPVSEVVKAVGFEIRLWK